MLSLRQQVSTTSTQTSPEEIRKLLEQSNIPAIAFGKTLNDFGIVGEELRDRISSSDFLLDRVEGRGYGIYGKDPNKHLMFCTLAKTLALIGESVLLISLYELTEAIRNKSELATEAARIKHLCIGFFDKSTEWPYTTWLREAVEEFVLTRRKQLLPTHIETHSIITSSKYYTKDFTSIMTLSTYHVNTGS